MRKKLGYALPFLEVPAVIFIEENDRFLPKERQMRIANKKRRASISVGMFVVDIVVPVIVTLVAMMDVA